MLGFVLALEEIARIDVSVAAIVFAHTSPATILALHGSAAARTLAGPSCGRSPIGGDRLTEPSGGRRRALQPGRPAHRMVELGPQWQQDVHHQHGHPLPGLTVIVAAIALVHETAPRPIRRRRLARSARSSCPTVPLAFVSACALHKIGWRAATTCEVFLDDCRVPAECLVGQPGDGLRAALAAITYGRVAVGAIATGLARGCFDLAVAYGKQRRAFGRAVTDRPSIGFALADLATRIDEARPDRAAALADVAHCSARGSRWRSEQKRRSRPQNSRSRSTARMASRASTRLPRCSGTPRCSRSWRGPPRSSGCSSRDSWA